jgi:hypothetical protein
MEINNLILPSQGYLTHRVREGNPVFSFPNMFIFLYVLMGTQDLATVLKDSAYYRYAGRTWSVLKYSFDVYLCNLRENLKCLLLRIV